MPYKRCFFCKKRISENSTSNFCSIECEQKYNNMPDKNCENCGNIIEKTSKKRFCDLKCANEFQKKKNTVERICINCHKKFYVLKSSKKLKLCSDECVLEYSKSKERNDKRLNTLKSNTFDKYGVEWYFQTTEYKDKYEQTCLSKYGVSNVLKNPDIRERIKQTNIEKYGVDVVTKNIDIQKKIKNTNLQKYGVERPLQNIDIKNKFISTCKSRYGVDWSTKSEEIKNIIKKSVFDKYGVDNVFNLDIVKNKIRQTLLDKYGNDIVMHIDTIIEKVILSRHKHTYKRILTEYKNDILPLFTEDEYKGGGYDKLYKFKCVKCGNEFDHWIYSGIIPRCEICYPKNSGTSHYETDIKEFLMECGILESDIIMNTKKVLPSGKELDIYIPEKKLAIEFDGIKWHSEKFGGKDSKYHLNKTNECESLGIRLVHIFENEWIYKNDIVKSILKSKLNKYDVTIYARNCIVKEVPTKEKDNFLIINHLQGKDISSYKYGLYYNDELISIMTFSKSRFNKNVEFEMVRYSNKLNYKIIGGASKLFSYFIKTIHPKSIISFSDRRYFDGRLYEKLGFNFIENTSPNYFYFQDKNEFVLRNRISFQKHKLLNLLEKYDPKLTEIENMWSNGYDRIFDCGNKKYIFYNTN